MKKNANSILLCLFEALVGILLLLNPTAFTSGIIIAVGIVLVILGVISVVNYFRTDAVQAAAGQILVKGLTMLLAGAFCAFRSQWFLVTFPAITMLYGVVILLTGLGKVQLCVDMLRLKRSRWYLAAISAVISVACAVVILRNPFTSTVVFWMFIGISLIVEAVLDAITPLVSKVRSEQ